MYTAHPYQPSAAGGKKHPAHHHGLMPLPVSSSGQCRMAVTVDTPAHATSINTHITSLAALCYTCNLSLKSF